MFVTNAFFRFLSGPDLILSPVALTEASNDEY